MARKLAEASFNDIGNLDDINIYQIIIVLSARKLAETSFNDIGNLDDINIYQIIIVFSARKLAEASFNNIGIWMMLIFTKKYASFGSQARRSVIQWVWNFGWY